MFNFLYFNVLPNFSTVVPLRLLPRRDNSLLKSIQYDLLCFQKGISPFFFVAAKKRYVKTPFAATNKCYFVATYVIVRSIWFMIRFYFFHFSFLLSFRPNSVLISTAELCWPGRPTSWQCQQVSSRSYTFPQLQCCWDFLPLPMDTPPLHHLISAYAKGRGCTPSPCFLFYMS